jgi:ribonuclease HI
VLGALRYKDWVFELIPTVVIATDSEYAVSGSTAWASQWARNGWVTTENTPVENKDLWQAIFGEVERLDELGTRVQFWKIPRESNMVVDEAAKAAVLGFEAWFRDIGGMLEHQQFYYVHCPEDTCSCS